jgi:hypothetical protein
VIEDCGFIPSASDWLKAIHAEPWMRKVGTKLPTESPPQSTAVGHPYVPLPSDYIPTN